MIPVPPTPPWPRVGSIILYVLTKGPSAGETRPAIVTSGQRNRFFRAQVFCEPEDGDEAERFVGTPAHDAGETPARGTWRSAGPTDPPDPG